MFNRFFVRFVVAITLLVSSFTLSAQERNYLPETWRIFAKHMLFASDQPETVKAKAFTNAIASMSHYFDSPAIEVEVSSLEEYVDEKYEVERYTFLDFEMRHLREGKSVQRKIFKFKNEEVKLAIHQYHLDQYEYAKSQIKEFLDHMSVDQSSTEVSQLGEFVDNALREMIDLEDPTTDGANPEVLFRTLKNINVSAKNQILMVDAFGKVFDRIEAEIRTIGEKLARLKQEQSEKEGNKEMSGPLAGAGRFLELLLGGVFRYEEPEGIRNMISGFIDFPDQRDDVEKFGLLIRYSFPQIQKILQILADLDDMPEEVQEEFKKLQSKGKAAPGELVAETIEAYRKDMLKQGIELVSYDKKAVHAGTIAQIHLGKIRVDGEIKEVAFRVIKPGILEAIRRGDIVMEKSADLVDNDEKLKGMQFPNMKSELGNLRHGIVADVDTVGGSERQDTGDKLYTFTYKTEIDLEGSLENKPGLFDSLPFLSKGKKRKKLIIHYTVPKVYYHTPAGSEAPFMIMDRVHGSSLNKVKEKVSPVVSNAVAKGMINKWLEVAFVKEGFYHGDLHPGNFLNYFLNVVNGEDNLEGAKILLESESTIEMEVPIIDYGMGGTLPMNQRTYFMGIAIAAKLRDPVLMRDMFWKIRDVEKTTVSAEKLLEILTKKVEEDIALDKKIKRASEEEAEKLQKKKMTEDKWVVVGLNAGVKLPTDFVGLSRGTGALMALALEHAVAKGFGDMMKGMLKERPSLMGDMLFNGLIPKKELVKSVGRSVKRSCMQILK